MKEEGIKYLDATREAEDEWRAKVKMHNDKTLFPNTKSWYMGYSGPADKPKEQLNWPGGLPEYNKECWEAIATWKGFVVA